ncbi:class I SAM-dependent RNA methyltransferase [Acetobacter nitrogenifigens]|uniref:RNA methyltransferase n=1 Tax=Acetobacter nitrogenifigens DSM 23921 = NBRC 105050 TaxID=1120919 RepID=A0A511XBL7_9PROT|nr:class I SAM-dependent RNA methyltransferase [Acetobacter nitrogenifigens]GEN60271.1 RNA methyltransferase [Acetobacter nitrogenifigens DSM 23921 = NBRC 105050]
MARKADPRRPRTPPPPESFGPARLYVVDRLGAGGDGVARAEQGDDAQTQTTFIPFTAPGDTVMAQPVARGRASCERIVAPSPVRVTPPCALFGQCGGCALQHLPMDWTLSWKVEQIVTGLRHSGFAEVPEPRAVQSPPSTRRRAEFALKRNAGVVVIGLHRRGGDVLDLTECHVLHPGIMALLPPLRALLPRLDLLRGSGDLLINLLDSGPDLLFTTDAPPSSADRGKLAAFAREHAIPRIGWRPGLRDEPETVSQLGPVRQVFGDASVEPPLGAFLQATATGEAAIRDAVLDATPATPGRKAKIIELYAGCGTLTFPLAERARVEAYEGHPAALQTLRKAAAGRRVDAAVRDLNRQPVDAKDLGGALAVVLDPPYTGAGAQMEAILRATPKALIYVSCNPQVLLKDAKSLFAAGYSLDAVTVVDQFLWSPEIETVCRFSRKPHRLRR